MKTFFTLAVAFVLGSAVALTMAGCDNKPAAPPAKAEEKKPAEEKKVEAPPAKTDEAKPAEKK